MTHKADASWDGPDDFVFATASGLARNRSNERRAALLPAIEKANTKLRRLGIAPRRQRLTGAHRAAFDRALEWAQMGTSADYTVPVVLSKVNAETRNAA